MHLGDVFRIRRIDEGADCDEDVARADVLFLQRMGAAAVEHGGHVVVLVDDQRGHEALAGRGQGDRDRARIQIEHGFGIQRVAIHADDVLGVDGDRFAAMHELAQSAVGHHLAQVQIGLGASEIIDGDLHCGVGRGLCVCARECGQRQGGDAGYGRMGHGKPLEWEIAATVPCGLGLKPWTMPSRDRSA